MKTETRAGGLVYDLLDAQAARLGDAPAAQDPDKRLTFVELKAEVDAFAKGLLAKGVRRGDRVAMLTAPSVDFWIVFHAVTSLGAIWLGVNPRYQRRDFEHVLEDATPALLVVMSPLEGRDYCEELSALSTETPMVCIGTPSSGATSIEGFLAQGAAVSDAQLSDARGRVDPEDPALIVYTSGTTGKPKGALLSHRAIVASARVNCEWMGGENLRSSVCAAPVNHVGAINNLCMPILAAGGRLIFYPRVDIPALAALSRREMPTYLVSSPTGFAMMLQSPEGLEGRLAHTRLIVFGGAVTPRPILEQIDRPGLILSNVYGQTETCGIITRTPQGASLEVMSETIGQVLPGADLRLRSASGQPVSDGVPGEIQVKGPYIMSGYFRNPSASAEAFTEDGYLRTGDLGIRRPDGNIVFAGRLKEMFKSGGYNVYPVEVEQAICEHPAAQLAAVVPRSHPTYQEVGHAFVETAPGCTLEEDELRSFLRLRIANYKIPKSFTVTAELPKLPNGKVDKAALKAMAVS